MGPRLDGTSLDKIDNNKGYFKENCKWATPVEQANNKRNNINLTFENQTKSLSIWAREIGITDKLFNQRLFRDKWPLERILKNPNKTELTKYFIYTPDGHVSLYKYCKGRGVSSEAIRRRIIKGMSIAEAISKPIRIRKINDD